jgi:catechol 2,3-dioxygenase-like lactoylglutathione lyase family enzyme
MKRSMARLLACLAMACGLLGSIQANAEQPAAPSAQFHHVHLNSTDPAAAVEFYTAKFKARKETFGDLGEAVWTGDSWLLFSAVTAPPPSELISGIWHIGWGAEDMQTTYRRQVDSGTKFATPITDITAMTGGSRPFYYAYVAGPDGALIELNTANHHSFGHVHMFSADPPAAGAWYARNFGWRFFAQSQKREFRGIQIAPAAFVTAGHVSMIIYPIEYVRAAVPDAWQGRTDFVTTRGRVVDHLGFSVPDLDITLEQLRKNGVTVTAEPASAANGQLRFAFVEGPDQVAIELIEDRTTRPAQIAE